MAAVCFQSTLVNVVALRFRWQGYGFQWSLVHHTHLVVGWRSVEVPAKRFLQFSVSCAPHMRSVADHHSERNGATPVSWVRCDCTDQSGCSHPLFLSTAPMLGVLTGSCALPLGAGLVLLHSHLLQMLSDGGTVLCDFFIFQGRSFASYVPKQPHPRSKCSVASFWCLALHVLHLIANKTEFGRPIERP